MDTRPHFFARSRLARTLICVSLLGLALSSPALGSEQTRGDQRTRGFVARHLVRPLAVILATALGGLTACSTTGSGERPTPGSACAGGPAWQQVLQMDASQAVAAIPFVRHEAAANVQSTIARTSALDHAARGRVNTTTRDKAAYNAAMNPMFGYEADQAYRQYLTTRVQCDPPEKRTQWERLASRLEVGTISANKWTPPPPTAKPSKVHVTLAGLPGNPLQPELQQGIVASQAYDTLGPALLTGQRSFPAGQLPAEVRQFAQQELAMKTKGPQLVATGETMRRFPGTFPPLKSRSGTVYTPKATAGVKTIVELLPAPEQQSQRGEGMYLQFEPYRYVGVHPSMKHPDVVRIVAGLKRAGIPESLLAELSERNFMLTAQDGRVTAVLNPEHSPRAAVNLSDLLEAAGGND